MDLLAIASAVVGFILASKGFVLIGVVLSFGGLTSLALALARTKSLTTVLPFTFGSHFVVMALCIIGAAVVQKKFPSIGAALFGFWLYYYACIAIAERKIRYVPWGRGLSLRWNTALATERPIVYWTSIVLCMGVAALMFALALARA